MKRRGKPSAPARPGPAAAPLPPGPGRGEAGTERRCRGTALVSRAAGRGAGSPQDGQDRGGASGGLGVPGPGSPPGAVGGRAGLGCPLPPARPCQPGPGSARSPAGPAAAGVCPGKERAQAMPRSRHGGGWLGVAPRAAVRQPGGKAIFPARVISASAGGGCESYGVRKMEGGRWLFCFTAAPVQVGVPQTRV